MANYFRHRNEVESEIQQTENYLQVPVEEQKSGRLKVMFLENIDPSHVEWLHQRGWSRQPQVIANQAFPESFVYAKTVTQSTAGLWTIAQLCMYSAIVMFIGTSISYGLRT